MSLPSICNPLFDNAIQGHLHAEPHLAAAEPPLHERIPPETGAEPEMAGRCGALADAPEFG